VYRACIANFTLACKVFNVEALDEHTADTVMREFRLVQMLQPHENIVQYFAIDQISSPQEWRLFMPIYDSTLRQALNETARSLSVLERIDAARQVAAAIAHMHSCHVVHRDIKAENVLVRYNHLSALAQCVLSDFGEAREIPKDPAELERGMSSNVGSCEFMAPEKISKTARDKVKYDEKSDVFSYGMMLFELITNEIPFRREGLAAYELLESIKSGLLPSFPDGTIHARIAGLHQLYIDCTLHDPLARLSAFAALQRAKRLLDAELDALKR
jgi:serine/threonine-protein kinase